jgi:hypothetical protein
MRRVAEAINFRRTASLARDTWFDAEAGADRA